ncbi:MAG: acetyltransferase [Phenylobacterium sp.]|uniref:acetyltransferase n=1 Tax=Phenylobacterium sp. TaxID=1871053 RepID=UPI0025ECA9F4|nr:acetyltransferase [Phenylobacterium sp.]MBA4012712.1 acetyltransferase [Phenylobacterium sp.]
MIRRATAADAPALLALWRAAVEATHHFLTAADIDAIEAQVRGYLASDAQLWTVERDGRPVGFMGLDGDEIAALFVDPAVHRGGIGRALMAHAQARGATWLGVNEQNPGAIAFYQRLGFEVTDRSALDSEGRPFPILTMRRRV